MRFCSTKSGLIILSSRRAYITMRDNRPRFKETRRTQVLNLVPLEVPLEVTSHSTSVLNLVEEPGSESPETMELSP